MTGPAAFSPWRKRCGGFYAALSLALGALVSTTSIAQVGVYTSHNDFSRTGQNLGEVILTPANVNVAQFGKVFSHILDGQPYAQPLVVPNVAIPGKGTHNLVLVCTEHDTVYAFDADDANGNNANPLWQRSFLAPGVTPVPSDDIFAGYNDLKPEIGITGTPVIDADAGTLYVVAKTKETAGGTAHYAQRLHALDLATGADKYGGPVLITATVPGAGYNGLDEVMDAANGSLTFNPLEESQRAGLLLSNGLLTIAFGSHGDNDPYHGWLISYDARTLKQVAAFTTSPNGGQGGIWQTGEAPAADDSGHIFCMTSNGTFDASRADYGDAFLKLDARALTVQDYFAPYNQSVLADTDRDLGSGGDVLLPTQPGAHPHLIVGAGKEGTIYVLDRDNMGHYNAANDNQIVQVLRGAIGASFGSPAYWNGRIYFCGLRDVVKAFSVNNGALSATPVSQGSTTFGYPGASPVISANGNANAILWAIQNQGNGVLAILHAYKATDLSSELYNSSMAGERDQPGPNIKFAVPTVANGKVYVGSDSYLTTYGLLAGTPPLPLGVSSITSASATSVRVGFSRKADPATSSNAANYSISGGVAVSSASLAADGKTLTLTTSPLTPGTTYTLTVNNVTDTATPPCAVAPNTNGSVVYAPFELASAMAVSATTVQVNFNRSVDAASGANTANYAIDKGVAVSSAVGAGGPTVTLTTSSLAPGISYTLVVRGVADQSTPPQIVSFSPKLLSYPVMAVTYTLADAVRALARSAGIAPATPSDLARLDAVPSAPSNKRIDVMDACRIARIAMGVDAQP